MTESVAVIAAHPDDEVLGCGGTISRLANEGRDVHIMFLSDGESSRNVSKELLTGRIAKRRQNAEEACEIMGCKSVVLNVFADNRLDGFNLLDVVKPIEDFIQTHASSTVFTHHSGDVNIDHRIVHDAVIAATRPQPSMTVKELFFFEVASSTEWRPPTSGQPFTPNLFVDITNFLEKKVMALKSYEEELRPFPHPRSVDAVTCLAKWRGATVGVNAAEAFYIGRKII